MEETEKTTHLELCQGCKKNKAKEPHSCPYASDINGDDNPEYCTCCADCTNDCLMDI